MKTTIKDAESEQLRAASAIRDLAKEAGINITVSGVGHPKRPPDARLRFSENVRAAMDKAGLSIGDLNEISGLRYLTLVSYRDGKRIPSGDHLEALAAALGVTSDVIMRGVKL